MSAAAQRLIDAAVESVVGRRARSTGRWWETKVEALFSPDEFTVFSSLSTEAFDAELAKPGVIIQRTGPRRKYRHRQLSEGELELLEASGLLGIEVDIARENGLSPPRCAWSVAEPHALSSVRDYRDYGEKTLNALTPRETARHIARVIAETTTAVRFLYGSGLSHGDIRASNVVKSREWGWLLVDPIAIKHEPAAQLARIQTDIVSLVNTWVAAFCEVEFEEFPILRGEIRAWLTHRNANRCEVLIGWAARHARDRTRIHPVRFFDRILSNLEPALSETEGNKHRAHFCPPEWTAVIDGRSAMLYYPLMAEVNGESDDGLSLFRQLDLGIDQHWRSFIAEKVHRRLMLIERARRARAAARGGSIVAGNAQRSEEALWEDSAVNILNRLESQADLSRDALINEATHDAEETRERVLEKGVVSLSTYAESARLPIGDAQVFLRTGRLVGVVDHEEILLPTFQFSSPEAQDFVGRVNREVAATYPSWLWTAWWCEGFYGPTKLSLADILLAGAVAQAEEAVRPLLATQSA